MRIKNKKMVLGAAIAGVGFIVREINTKKKLKIIDWKIRSMSKSMDAFANAHNSLVDEIFKDEKKELLEKDCENEKFDAIVEEIGSVYEHIARLATEGK